MKLLLTRLEVLNHSIYKTTTGKPIHNIQYRIKKKDSIEEKLKLHGFAPTVENAKDQLQDIAGIRIICYFVGDVNNLVAMLKNSRILFLSVNAITLTIPSLTATAVTT